MIERCFEEARQYALGRLEQELSPNLLYHGLMHTRDDVVPAVEKLAAMEGIEADSRYLLRTAAWFHDLGFVEQSANHEQISIRIAAEVLPGLGYSETQIGIICSAIAATIIPQIAKSKLDQIVADADLNVLGRRDFLSRNKALRDELALAGQIFSDVDWYRGQLGFLEKHTFFTQSAARLWNDQKTANISEIRRLLTHRSQ